MSTRHFKTSYLLVEDGVTLTPQRAGKMFAECLATDKDLVAYMPPATDYTGSQLIIFKGSVPNQVVLTASTLGTITGSATATIELDDIGDVVKLYSDGTTWRPFKPTTVIKP